MEKGPLSEKSASQYLNRLLPGVDKHLRNQDSGFNRSARHHAVAADRISVTKNHDTHSELQRSEFGLQGRVDEFSVQVRDSEDRRKKVYFCGRYLPSHVKMCQDFNFFCRKWAIFKACTVSFADILTGLTWIFSDTESSKHNWYSIERAHPSKRRYKPARNALSKHGSTRRK